MARNKKRNEATDMDPNAWMVTFGDLLMLLLTFFVLLLSMSAMDDLALKRMLSVLTGAIGPLELVSEKNVRTFSHVVQAGALSEAQLLDDGNKLKSMLSQSKDPGKGSALEKSGVNVNIYNDSRGVVMSFKTNILFDSGKADIKPGILPVLKRIGEIIDTTSNDILIIGHTDNVPIHSDKYRSNWELSFFRGLSLSDYFQQESKIPPERFCIGGAGDSQPRYPNTTEGNREKNRRVEIIFRN
ncbi:MAG: OmpA family protein [Pseudomonadota bacterium]